MADFFDEVDAMGFMEAHVRRIRTLEDDQAERLLHTYREVRKDLIKRIQRFEATHHGPAPYFTTHQLRGTLAQVDHALEQMGDSLERGMREASPKAVSQGLKDLVTEIDRFQHHFKGAVVPISINATLAADETNNFLFNQYQVSIDRYTEGLREQFSQNIRNAIAGEKPAGELVRDMGLYFAGEEWKLRRIARTELHHAYGLGKLAGMEKLSQGPMTDLMKTLYHPMDSRTGADSKWAARLNLIVPIDEPFRYTWPPGPRGRLREFLVPPDRPNDRSVLLPWRQAWAN